MLKKINIKDVNLRLLNRIKINVLNLIIDVYFN